MPRPIMKREVLNIITDYINHDDYPMPYTKKYRRDAIQEAFREVFKVLATTLSSSKCADIYFNQEASERQTKHESFRDLQRSHIEHSQFYMLIGSQRQGTHICVLAPDTTEKPLMSIFARHFSHITLVGRSGKSLMGCFLAIPTGPRVDLINCDLSGLFEQSHEIISKALLDSKTIEEVIDDLSGAIFSVISRAYLEKAQFSIKPADYVISSLLISQLPGLLIDSCYERLMKGWSHAPNLVDQFNKWSMLAIKVVPVAHLIFLYNITKPDGLVYLSDTVHHHAYPDRTGSKTTQCVDTMSPELLADMAKLFTVHKENSWDWHMHPTKTWRIKQFFLKKRSTPIHPLLAR